MKLVVIVTLLLLHIIAATLIRLNEWKKSEVPIPTIQNNTLVIDKRDKWATDQAAFQALFFKPNTTVPFLIRAESKRTNNTFGVPFLYSSIKYKDGSLLPVWLMLKNDTTWNGECVTIPNYGKEVEDVLLVAGAYNVKVANESDEGIYFRNITFEKLSHNASMKDIPCSKVIQRTFLTFRTEPFAFRSLRAIDKNDVTIATQLTVDRLPHLLINAHAWGGPISASIYLRSSADYFAVQNFWSQHEQVRNHISIHLVYARDADEPDDPTIGKDLEYNYPVNYLRNVARKYVQTNYVLYLDADFVVPENLYNQTRAGKAGEMIKKLDPNQKAVIVLPAFNSLAPYHIPKNRDHLLMLLQDNLVERIRYGSHVHVQYDKWLDSKNMDFYEIPRAVILLGNTEPYFIAPNSLPLFDERFVGCGRDKVQHAVSTALAKFRFMVWKEMFITHITLKDEKSLCPTFPPPEFLRLAMIGHTFMVTKEYWGLRSLPYWNDQFQTVLRDPNQVHLEWLNKIKNDNATLHLNVTTQILSEKNETNFGNVVKEKKNSLRKWNVILLKSSIITIVFVTVVILVFFKRETRRIYRFS